MKKFHFLPYLANPFMHLFSALQPGDVVEIIAPASRCSDDRLLAIKNLLAAWQIDCLISPTLFGEDILCANTDEIRFHNLVQALQRPETKALICARGGYGSMRLLPMLNQVPRPEFPKLLLGMSDITALHLYIHQHWQWPTLLGSLSPDHLDNESIAAVKALLFNKTPVVHLKNLLPLNGAAEQSTRLHTTVMGGNLSLLQTSIGTAWELKAKNKLILIEEIGERAYRVDRMLSHLMQAGLLQEADAIVFGDFLECSEPNGASLIDPVLQRFAQQCSIPVLKIGGVGHGVRNQAIPLGTSAELNLEDLSLQISGLS